MATNASHTHRFEMTGVAQASLHKFLAELEHDVTNTTSTTDPSLASIEPIEPIESIEPIKPIKPIDFSIFVRINNCNEELQRLLSSLTSDIAGDDKRCREINAQIDQINAELEGLLNRINTM